MALTKIKTGGIADNAITDAKVADNITAGTAATLATARNINGVSFNGSSAITVTAAAGTLTGNTLASGVTASSLTSVGTLTGLTTGAITQNAGTLTIKNASSDSNGLKIYQDSSDASKIYNHYNGTLQLGVGSTTAITIDSSENTTFAGDIATSADKRLSVGTWDNSGFSGSAMYGLSITSSVPIVHLAESDETGKKAYFGMSGGNAYLGGNSITNLYFQTGSGTTALTIDSSQDATFAGNASLQGDSGTLNFLNASGTLRAFLQLSSTGLIIDTDSFLQFKPNNSEAMYINSSGFVGIQTHDTSGDANLSNTFGAPLHILQKTASQGYGLVVQGNSNANGGRIGIGEADSNFSSRANVIDIGFDSSTDFLYSRTGKDFIFGVNSAERMRILSDGRVAIKATSLPQDFGGERGHLCVSSTDNGGANNYAILQLQGHTINNDGSLGAIHFYDHSSSNCSIQANRQNNSGSGKLMFSTSESGGSKKVRMTIFDAGAVTIDNDNSSSPASLTVQNNGSSGWLGSRLILRSENDARRGAGVQMHNDAVGNSFFAGVIYNANFAKYSVCYESTGTVTQQTADSDHEVFHITSNGATYNDQNTWGDSSDKRIKHSIVDSNSQWDDIKALKVKNFKKIKHGDDAKSLIGVIAQDLEDSGMNGLVDEHPASESEIKMYKDIEEGDNIKSVKYSILYMKAIKALQEAMERIEALENA